MKNNSIIKTASLLLASASLMTVALTSCTPSEAPSEADKKAAEVAALSEPEKAAHTLLNYANGVKNNDSKLICDSLDQRIINMTTASFTSETDSTPPNCEEVFSTILGDSQSSKPQIIDGLNEKDLAGKSTKVSETLYSFPSDAISPPQENSTVGPIFVSKINDSWKISFDPAEETAVKEAEEELKKPSAPASSSQATTPAS